MDTNNVLAFVSLVGIALDGLNTTMLAGNFILLSALLVETIPPLAVVGTCSALFRPSSLKL